MLMQEASTRKIYDVQSMFYDATFGRLVKRRIERAIEHMKVRETDLVLDLGIGTGASLNYYPGPRADRRDRPVGRDAAGVPEENPRAWAPPGDRLSGRRIDVAVR